MKRPPLLSIKCLVYNHEPYLRQCLDGFVMQQTDFPFEAIVHDDASTDGSAEIIREYAEKYPDIIKPIYEIENQYSKKDDSLRRIMNAAIHPKSKYIALCEGDDYWTDPTKLQKQVDILENDSDVGLVFTHAIGYYHNENRFSDRLIGRAIESFEGELISNHCPTLTACIRKSLYFEYLKLLDEIKSTVKGWKMGDYPLWIYISHKCKTHFIPISTGVYRILEESASHSKNISKDVDFIINAYEISFFWANRFGYKKVLPQLSLNTIQRIEELSLNRNSRVDYDIYPILEHCTLKYKCKHYVKYHILHYKIGRHLIKSIRRIKNTE